MSKYSRRQFTVNPADWKLIAPSDAMLEGVSRWIVDNVSDDLPLPKLLRKLADQLDEHVLSCTICDATFSNARVDAKFCSKACYTKHHHAGHKYCSRCERVLPKSEYRVNSRNPSGLQGWCRPCTSDYHKFYRRETEAGRENRRKHRANVRVKKASPVWRDKAKIRAVYVERDRLIAETGDSYHVDHTIPLNGRNEITGEYNVCGLHVHNNLKPISADDNIDKSGWFTV